MNYKVIDVNNSEAFILLDDDSIIKVPRLAISNHATVNCKPFSNLPTGSFGCCNNHINSISKNDINNII